MWNINQDIVCIKDHHQGVLTEGKVYTIIGLRVGHCGFIQINVGIKSMHKLDSCTCGFSTINKDGYWWFSEKRFKPLDELSDISELLEVLNKENYQEV